MKQIAHLLLASLLTSIISAQPQHTYVGFEKDYYDDTQTSSPLTVDLQNLSNESQAYARYRVATSATSVAGAFSQFPENFYNPVFAGFTELVAYSLSDGLMLRTSATDGVIKFVTKHDEEKMRIDQYGNVGIGNVDPKSRLQVSDGDIFVDDIHKGVIMKSPNSQCWRYQPDNSGVLVGTAITCPN